MLLMQLTFGGDSSQPPAAPSTLFTDVKSAEAAYMRLFPLPTQDESPVAPLPAKAYRDSKRCVHRSVADAVFTAEQLGIARTWNALRCLPTALIDDGDDGTPRAPRGNFTLVSTLDFGVGVDRWAHPSLLKGTKTDERNADTAVLSDDNAVLLNADGTSAAVTTTPQTYFTKNAYETKVIRNVLYFRRARRNADNDNFGVSDDATPPPTPEETSAVLPLAKGEEVEDDAAGDGTDTSSVTEKPGDLALVPNDVAEKFVVASTDPYHGDQALYRRLTESEAMRAVKFYAKLRVAKARRRAANASLAATITNEAELDEAAEDSLLQSASKDHIQLVTSNFIGHRSTLGYFTSAASVSARPPDIMTLGDGFSSSDLRTVDVVKFMTVASKAGGLPPALRRITDEAANVVSGPSALSPSPRTVPLAFVVNLRTCLANHWHGTAEVALPLFALLARHGVITDAVVNGSEALPLIFVRAPPRNVWGGFNKGCPSLNQYPYGSASSSAWIFRVVAPNVIFFDERGEHRRYLESRPVQNLSVALTIDRLVVSGLDYDCGGTFDVMTFFTVATSWSPRRTSPGAAYPFLLSAPHVCDGFLPTFRRFMLGRLNVPDPGWVTPDEARCPIVVILDRQNARNGRHMVNWVEFFMALSEQIQTIRNRNRCEKLKGAVEVVKLHKLTPQSQMRKLQKATVVLAVRGAATISTAFVRPGVAIITLTPVHFSLPLSFRTDNIPWWPFYTLRKDVIAGLGVCRALPQQDQSSRFTAMCRDRSVNFCNMECDTTHTTNLVRVSLAAQSELVLEAALHVMKWRSVQQDTSMEQHGKIDAAVREEALASSSVVDGLVGVVPLATAVAVLDAKRPLWTTPTLPDMASPPDANVIKRAPFRLAIETEELRVGNTTIAQILERRKWYRQAEDRRTLRDSEFDPTELKYPRRLVTVIVPTVMHSANPHLDSRLFFDAPLRNPHL